MSVLLFFCVYTNMFYYFILLLIRFLQLTFWYILFMICHDFFIVCIFHSFCWYNLQGFLFFIMCCLSSVFSFAFKIFPSVFFCFLICIIFMNVLFFYFLTFIDLFFHEYYCDFFIFIFRFTFLLFCDYACFLHISLFFLFFHEILIWFNFLCFLFFFYCEFLFFVFFLIFWAIIHLFAFLWWFSLSKIFIDIIFASHLPIYR